MRHRAVYVGVVLAVAAAAGLGLYAVRQRGEPYEIIIDEFIGMARSKADVTYHATIWHWNGTGLVDVSHKFPEYYAETAIPYYEALLQTVEVPGAEASEYQAELEEALSLARGVVSKARQRTAQ